MYDLISIGDTTTDVFLQVSKDEVRVLDVNQDGIDDLVMDFGSKVPVEKLTRVSAVGNAANNTIGAARLGLSAAIYTIVGNDASGNEAKEVFGKEGVALDYVQVVEGTRTNFSAVINVGAERTILVFHESRKYDLPEMAETKWIYFTSLGKGHEELHTDIPSYLEKTKAKFAFQPGSHQLREGLEVLKPLIARCDFLVMNKEEAQGLQNKKQAECPELVRGFIDLGAKVVAVTDGPKGSFASDGGEVLFQDIYDIEVIERTGCGDSYSTAFVAALIKDLGVGEAMKWGTVNAAGVLRFVGAREGLLKEEELRKWLEQKPDFGPVPV